ncbi:hypothetical protein Goarm_011841 [Gossypium armourianum]|uniref:Uncharacterized protein n=1 Tax=Gossypium armourianum TaxID=34283 RepID=A0A7J9IZN9_9ROSI|nr:hypothetical protein [Gossypium armourianum]
MALDHLHSFHSLPLLNAKLLLNDYGKDTLCNTPESCYNEILSLI